MTDHQFRRLMDLVGEACELPESDRDAFLKQQCGDDASLLQEARALIRRAGDTSVDAVTAQLRQRVEEEAGHMTAAAPPPTIANYRIVEKLGEGGMGTVYLARQESPIQREVALKVVRTGAATQQVLIRFEAERQALASMAHPGIASVYDAGTTEDGLPYFAMEHVRGEPITGYADGRAMSLQQRLELFARVCNAIQHAHFRGVIHRDIKPSNVLVGEVDGKPLPKVIDFGIAKVVSESGDDATRHTRLGTVMGTLEYMSPEQASGAAGIDTRSDVYSLGVLLYELASGGLPFETEALRDLSPADLQRVLSNTEPPTPSARLSSLNHPDEVARQRNTDTRTLTRHLRGDLDWVVMKALERDPERRYASAQDLATDVERVIHHEPVEARAPTLLIRSAKFYRRHKLAVTAGILSLLAIVVGATFATVGFVRAAEEKRIAEREASIAGETSRFLNDMLAAARPDQAKGKEVTVREMLDIAAARLTSDESMDPEVEARLRYTLGESYGSLALYDLALPQLYRGIELGRQSSGEPSELLLQTLDEVGRIHWLKGDQDSSLVYATELASWRERQYGKVSSRYSGALSNVANTHADLGHYAVAESLHRECLAIDRAVLTPENRSNLAFTLNNLATVLVDQKRFGEAIPLHTESIAIRREEFGDSSPAVVIALMNLGAAQSGLESWSEAETTLRDALARAEIVYGHEHIRTAIATMNLSKPVAELSRTTEALALGEEAMRLLVKVIGPDKSRTALARSHLGKLYIQDGQVARGEEIMEAAWKQMEGTMGADNARTREVAASLAAHYDQKGERALAELWSERATGTSD